jgi:hypothetical protein
MNLADELYLLFVKHGYTWKIDGILQEPSALDIRIALDKAKELLYAEIEPSMTCELGHLVLKKTPGHLDIYVHIGDEPPTEGE